MAQGASASNSLSVKPGACRKVEFFSRQRLMSYSNSTSIGLKRRYKATFSLLICYMPIFREEVRGILSGSVSDHPGVVAIYVVMKALYESYTKSRIYSCTNAMLMGPFLRSSIPSCYLCSEAET